MEAGNLLRTIPLFPTRHSGHRRLLSLRPTIKASSDSPGGYRGLKPRTELVADWVSNNDDFARSLPIYVGGVSLLAVLFNRTVSGIAPVADASSSQSRADLLTLGMAVTNILAGLIWLSIQPKTISVVDPQEMECERIHEDLPDFVASELLWAWESLLAATCCRSLVIVYDNRCVLQIGCAAASSTTDGEPVVVDANKLMQGSLYQGVIKSGSQSYLTNLSLHPGKSELPFLPSNTQAILQPLGDKGIAIIGGNTIRGFTTSDQAWISLMGEKLDATLSKFVNSLKFKIEIESKQTSCTFLDDCVECLGCMCKSVSQQREAILDLLGILPSTFEPSELEHIISIMRLSSYELLRSDGKKFWNKLSIISGFPATLLVDSQRQLIRFICDLLSA